MNPIGILWASFASHINGQQCMEILEYHLMYDNELPGATSDAVMIFVNVFSYNAQN